MDIVWRKGQAPRKIKLADNTDFGKSANMKTFFEMSIAALSENGLFIKIRE